MGLLKDRTESFAEPGAAALKIRIHPLRSSGVNPLYLSLSLSPPLFVHLPETEFDIVTQCLSLSDACTGVRGQGSGRFLLGRAARPTRLRATQYGD